MKFDVEIIKNLYGCNDDGMKIVLSEGDEVYLKLDLEHMNLWDKEKYMQKYPDGWVRGILFYISNAGKRIKFQLFDDCCTYFLLNQKDIIAVSDKKPN
jgi:hypothetical protein